MENLRKYGHEPFKVAVIHGGPGAPGEMAPVARELSSDTGILEPLQTANSVQGQIDELKSVLEKNGHIPLVLIGFSWGAWLGFMVAAQYPLLVRKLVIISSGAFEEKYAVDIIKTRLNRLNGKEKEEALYLMESLNSPDSADSKSMARFGELMSQADAYDPLPGDSETWEVNPDIYRQVWEQASKLRSSGELLKVAEKIRCPVVAIHGDYDPHSAEGVKKPLSLMIKDFRFILLPECGHCPWLERNARDRFYRILRSEISSI